MSTKDAPPLSELIGVWFVWDLVLEGLVWRFHPLPVEMECLGVAFTFFLNGVDICRLI